MSSTPLPDVAYQGAGGNDLITESKLTPVSTSRNETESANLEKAENVFDDSISRMAILTIVLSWLAALVFAIGNHIYLHSMNGKIVHEGNWKVAGSDFWIKTGANILVRAVVLSLTVAGTATLTQMAWVASVKRPVKMEDLNKLFKLPSMSAFAQLLVSPLAPYIAIALLLVLALQGLEAVTVLSPNALKVVQSIGGIRELNIQSLDFTKAPVTSVDVFDTNAPGGGNAVGYIQPSAFWTRTVQTVMLHPEVQLTPPAQCVTGCSYSIQYQAPSLSCRDLATNEIQLKPYSLENTAPTLYQSTDTIRDMNATDKATSNSFRIEWQSFAFNNSETDKHAGPLKGVECQFYNSTYSVDVDFKTANQTITPRITNQGEVLKGYLPGQDPFACIAVPQQVPPTCWVNAVNYRATEDAFARMLNGSIAYNDSGQLMVVDTSGSASANGFTSGTPELPDLFVMETRGDGGWMYWHFDLAVNDLGKTLESMFTNATIALVAARQDLTPTQVTLFGGENQWSYNWKILIGIYAISLFVFGVFCCYGVWSIIHSGARDNTLMSFLLATRSPEIEKICQSAPDVDALKNVELRYRPRRTFTLHEGAI